MKRLISLIVTILLSVTFITASGQQAKKDPAGTWKFEAPYAPEGYNTGTIQVGMTENKMTATIGLTGSDYKIPGEKVRFENEQLLFSVYLEGAEISIVMKMESNTKMTGYANTPDGQIPISLVKEEVKK